MKNVSNTSKNTIWCFPLIMILIMMSLSVVAFGDTCSYISNFHFYIYLVIVILDFIKDNASVSLIQVFLVGVIYIIIPEGLLYGYSHLVPALRFLFVSVDFVLFGYFIFSTKNHRISRQRNFLISFKTPMVGLFLWLVYLLFLYKSVPGAIYAYSGGRSTSSGGGNLGSVLNIVIKSSGLVLPALLAFYGKMKGRSIVWSLAMSIPIFLIIFLKGTRFPLLFSLLGYCLTSGAVTLINMKLKTVIMVLAVAFLLNEASSMMREFRVFGLQESVEENSQSNQIQVVDKEKLFSQKVASHLSAEGIVDMMDLSMRYFEYHPHTYGLSLSFPLYFWIPRAIWPSKPTMIGYWLVREERIVGETHSASFGFVGEAYADFGIFSSIIMFLLGMLIKRMNEFKDDVFRNAADSNKVIIASMLYPYVFFMVRSPVTGTITFIGVAVYYFLYSKIIEKYKKYNDC